MNTNNARRKILRVSSLIGKKNILFLGLSIIFLSTLGTSHAFAQNIGFSIYENSDIGVRLDYPDDWVVDDSLFGAVYFYSTSDGPDDDFADNVVVVIEYLNQPITLDEYFNILIESEEFSGASITEQKFVSLGDTPTKQYTSLIEIEGQEIEQTLMVSIKDETAFLFALTTESETTSKYMPVFEAMKVSFEILSASETTGQDVRDLLSEAHQLYLDGLLYESLSTAEKIIKIQPNHYDALFLKAQVLVELGKNVDAEKAADKILEMSGYDPSAYFIKAIALFGQEKYEESIENIDEYLFTSPKDSGALSLKGMGLAELGYIDEAKAIIDEALELNPDFAFSLYAKGYYYYIMYDYTQAILFIDKAIALDPNPDYRNDKAVALMDQGQSEQAEEVLDKILNEYPNHSFALNNKGVLLLDRGNNDQAYEYFDKASEIEPDNLLFLRNKIAALSSSGIPDLAQIVYNQILQLDPNYDEPLESITTGSTSLENVEDD